MVVKGLLIESNKTCLTTLSVLIHKVTHGNIYGNLVLHLTANRRLSLHSSTTKIRNRLLSFLLNSPVPLDFIGYPGQVSLDAAHVIMSCFNNMFFQSFHHHSQVCTYDVLLTGLVLFTYLKQ